MAERQQTAQIKPAKPAAEPGAHKEETHSTLEKAKDSLEASFNKAKQFFEHGFKLDISDEQKIRMKALLKQATIGDCSGEQPKEEDEQKVWRVWCSLKGMARTEAMKEYVQLLSSTNKNWEQTHAQWQEEGQQEDTKGPSTLEKAKETIKETYDKAVDFAQKKLDLPEEKRTLLGALWQQATHGDCTLPEPNEVGERNTWNDWCSLKGMSKTDAMKEYIKVLTTHQENWHDIHMQGTAKSENDQSFMEKTREALKSRFDQAVHFVQFGAKQDMPEELQCRMAALLKQSARGDCTEAEPEDEHAKTVWNDWCSFKGMGRIEAMKEYVRLLQSHKEDWDKCTLTSPASDDSKANKSEMKETEKPAEEQFQKPEEKISTDKKAEKPAAAQIEKQSQLPDEKKMGKQQETDKPLEQKPEEKKIEKPAEQKQVDKIIEKSAEQKPDDKKIEKTADQQPEKKKIEKVEESKTEKTEDKKIEKKADDSKQDDSGLLHRTIDSVRTTFDRYVQFAKQGLHKTSTTDRDRLAALFNQATHGDITVEEPTKEDDKPAWKAWNALKGTSAQDAMKQYIHLLASSKTEWEECERFAKEAEKVSQLMEDMDIKETACVACKSEKAERLVERPAEAYIWTPEQKEAAARREALCVPCMRQPEKTWAALARQNCPEKDAATKPTQQTKQVEAANGQKEGMAADREQVMSEKDIR